HTLTFMFMKHDDDLTPTLIPSTSYRNLHKILEGSESEEYEEILNKDNILEEEAQNYNKCL
ncbi:7680_t:CDS:2, partial [Entrophospora sp. SA101]